MCATASNSVNVEPEFCSGAIAKWLAITRDGIKKEKGECRSEFSMKAKKHLSALGWTFMYVTKGQGRELRYVSPAGKRFNSLATACESCVEIAPEDAPQPRRLAPQETSGGRNSLPESKVMKRKGQMQEGRCNLKRRRGSSVRGMENGLDGDGGTREVETEEKEETRIREEEVENKVKPGMGKSLRKMLERREEKQPQRSSTRIQTGRSGSDDTSADLCSVCCCGSELVLCDGCPSAFHYGCIGLTCRPEGELWFCPPCRCGVCGSRESTRDSLVTCEQCRGNFHYRCVKQDVEVSYKGVFCSAHCKQLHSALENLMQKKIELRDGELVWRLLRGPDEDESHDPELTDKLQRCLKLLHQYFRPLKDPFTGRDLLKDMIFGGESIRARVNSHRFYTVVLEKKNKIVTVATVRVHRDIAEVPYVATALKYRKHGMCRTMMTELEKQMSMAGVRRLVLPSVADLVKTWTERFGFSAMEESERLKLQKHRFLEFYGTVMCQKFLMRRLNSNGSGLTEKERTRQKQTSAVIESDSQLERVS